MRAGAVSPGKPVRSANGIAGGGAGRGVPLVRSGKSVKTAQGAEIVQSSGSKSGTLKTEVNGSVQTDRQKHIGRAKVLKTMSVRYTEVVKTKHSRSVQTGRQKSTGRAEALKTAQDKGSEITRTTPAGGTEVAKTKHSGSVQTSGDSKVTKTVQSSEITETALTRGAEAVKTEHSMQTDGDSKIANTQARALPVKGARISAKNRTAHQRGAKQRGLEDAPAPVFPRRRLTSSEVKQLVDRAMEKLKEERPADYALLYELYFNRVSLRSLSRTLRIPRSTLRYRKRLALARIKQIIETLTLQK